MASSSSKSMVVVEKPSQEPLKCPRCDSSNTKFCYYNNYSLSQPRHFCKACKRYWTRGGTLRNVPVGGGCRKNKRVKRQPPSNGGGVVSKAVEKATTTTGNPSFLQPRVDLSRSSSISNSSLLYSLPSANNINPLEFRFPFSGLSSAKVSSDHHSAGLLFDLQPQAMSDLGIGFSSSTSKIVENGGIQSNNGFKDFIQDHVINNSTSSSSSSPFLNPMLFGSSPSSSSAFAPSTSMASLLASTIQQHNYANRGDLKDIETRNNFQSLMQYYEDNSAQPSKLNNGQQCESNWDSNLNPNSNLYQISQINSSDPNSSLLWNTSNVSSAWFDPSNNMGSSVPSLI